MVFAKIKSLFFNNTSTKQTIFKNTFWLSFSEAITRLLGLFLFIYVANILGATEYGKFAFALSIVYLLNVFYGLTSPQIITREIAQDKEKIKEISAIFSLKVILGILSLILMIIISFFVTNDIFIRKVIWLLSIYVLLTSFLEIILAFVRAKQKMEYEFLMKVFQTILFVSLGFFVIFNFPSIINLSYSYLFSVLISLLVFLFIFHFKIHPLKFDFNIEVWKRILIMSWPLALISIFSTLYNQIDSAMMGFWGQLTQTGWYNASYKIIGASLIPANLIALSFYPSISRAFKESKEKFQQLWEYHFSLMIFLAIPIMIGGLILAPKIINFFYDSSYAPSVFAFKILIIMAGTIMFYIPLQQGLIIINQQVKFFWAVFIGVFVNVGLNYFLIPKFSLYGAAVATVITNFIILLILIIFSIKLMPIKLFNSKVFLSIITALISTLIMYFVITNEFIYSLHIILSIFIGGLVYLICFFGVYKVLNKILNIKND